jgi:aspartyl protease family protein
LGYAAAMRNDFFYEPERGGGVVGWAVRQLVLWLVGGLAVYWLVTSYGLVRPSSGPAAEPQAQLQPQSQVPAADLAPAERAALGRPAPIVSNALSLRARADGYVYVKADVNGTPMTMAFDTGASMVSLTQADAARAGVAGNLNYTLSFGTANGRGLGAPVTLREIRIGQLVVQDVNAVVMQNLNTTLLGQTFLNRLESYQMRQGVLTLSWH